MSDGPDSPVGYGIQSVHRLNGTANSQLVEGPDIRANDTTYAAMWTIHLNDEKPDFS
jgi:hypothetical protein